MAAAQANGSFIKKVPIAFFLYYAKLIHTVGVYNKRPLAHGARTLHIYKAQTSLSIVTIVENNLTKKSIDDFSAYTKAKHFVYLRFSKLNASRPFIAPLLFGNVRRNSRLQKMLQRTISTKVHLRYICFSFCKNTRMLHASC